MHHFGGLELNTVKDDNTLIFEPSALKGDEIS
jgi:hypothetical protein